MEAGFSNLVEKIRVHFHFGLGWGDPESSCVHNHWNSVQEAGSVRKLVKETKKKRKHKTEPRKLPKASSRRRTCKYRIRALRLLLLSTAEKVHLGTSVLSFRSFLGLFRTKISLCPCLPL